MADIASKKGIQILTRFRKIKLLTEAIDEELSLWQNVIESLKEVNLLELFPEELPHEDEINVKICEKLNERFDKVLHKAELTGSSHIDLLVNDTIPIEVKKIESNTPKDELVGQISEDMRILDYNYGISYGIDLTISRKYLKLNNYYYGPYRNIVNIIKPY